MTWPIAHARVGLYLIGDVMAKVGRPTKYTKEMPQKIYDYLAQGHSLTQFAVSIGVHKDTVYEWVKEHPEFSDAFARAKQASQAHWERELVSMMYDRNVNAPLVKMYFANRFGWSDKKEVDNTSSDNSMAPLVIVRDAGKKD